MALNPRVLSASTPISEFARLVTTDSSASWFLVEERGKIVGIVKRDEALKALDDSGRRLQLKDVVQRSYVTVTEDTTLSEVLELMTAGGAQVAMVVSKFFPHSPSDVLGLITKESILAAEEEALVLFG